MEKKIGYSVFLLGVALVLYALYCANGVLSGINEAPKLLSLTSISLPMGGAQMELPLPPDFNKMANMFIYTLSCGFISMTGWILGLLGIGLVRAANTRPAEKK